MEDEEMKAREAKLEIATTMAVKLLQSWLKEEKV